MKISWIRPCLLLPLLLVFCGKGGSSGENQTGSGTGAPAAQIPADTFLSAENPGPWKDRTSEHTILVRDARIYNEGKKSIRELAVNVPLQGDARHYLEVGFVLDNSMKKELAKVSFKPGTPVYDFKLPIPADNPHAVFVVIKCNQHDMWVKRVEPLPEKKDGE